MYLNLMILESQSLKNLKTYRRFTAIFQCFVEEVFYKVSKYHENDVLSRNGRSPCLI